VLAIALVAFMLAGRASTGRAAAPSLAILPFTADASDTDARKLASAAHDAVAHTLSQGAFAISAIDVPAPGGAPSADFLISGKVTSAPDRFVATVRMEETAHHFVVFSHQFEAKRNEVGDFPERIGAQVASQLSWTAPLLALERRHPSEPAIVAALLQSDTSGQGGDVATLRDYETARRLAEKAPNSPLAQNQLAFNTAFALDQIPRAERAEAVMAARRAADWTIKLAPEYGSAYVPWCLLHSTVELAACEQRLRTGMRADADDPFANWFLSRLLNNVGRNAEAVQLASLSLAHDPYMPLKIAQSVRLLEATGRTEEAGKLYRQSTIWWPANEAIIWYRLSGMMERGDFAAMEQFGDEVGGDFKPSAALAAIARRSLPNARHECANPRMPDEIPCLLGLADLGDLDAAFSLADRVYPSLLGRSPTEQDHIWLESPGQSPFGYITSPAAAALRHDPRYLALAQRTGLLAYWRNGRLPDFCNPPHPEPVCARL
jgi:TolB-like protein